ncbi:UPF0764 protein C16orf89 [Plecturocebus cupreus]
MGFHHIGQAGLELLTSSDLPSSAFQNASIKGMSHRSRLSSNFRDHFTLVAQAGVQWHNLISLQPRPPRFKRFSSLSLLSKRQYAQLSFVFLVKMGFLYVDQAGLKLLTSGICPPLPPKVLGLQV